jgi:hypothetical protein
MDNENHTLTVGLRFDLERDQRMEPTPVFTAPPPPVTPPAPRQFVVYFGFNKTSLSKAAKETVSEAASAAMRDGFASILVTGHTDTVGRGGGAESADVILEFTGQPMAPRPPFQAASRQPVSRDVLSELEYWFEKALLLPLPF